MRQILLFLAFLFGIWWLRRKFSGGGRRQDRSAAPPPRELTEKISPCSHCGIHVPESVGVQSNGHFYCSEEHRRLAERA